MKKFTLSPGFLSLKNIECILDDKSTLQIKHESYKNVQLSRNIVDNIINNNKIVYGINTGFGILAKEKISSSQVEDLQKRLIMSHAAGTGNFLDNKTVKLILLLKINSLAQGYSGISVDLLNYLIVFYNNDIYPLIPEEGSVGASGDLAPLAHMSLAFMGIGNVKYKNRILPVFEVLQKIGVKPYILKAKEGLAILNGTQVSLAIAIRGLIKVMRNFSLATVTGSLSIDATKSSIIPFNKEIACLKRSMGQQIFSTIVRTLLRKSEIMNSHFLCKKVQDPYCIRCQPQVMGAILDKIFDSKLHLEAEINSVSDNPLIIFENQSVISGGNFHAEGVAINSDILGIISAEIGSISERRIAMLMDRNMSGLPSFLVKNSGLNSGFMIPHVTAASLVSENKVYAHPASVDTIPTSANQEDHVSMATVAARKMNKIADNTLKIIAIEYLAASQGLDFHLPNITSPKLYEYYSKLRKKVSFYKEDRIFFNDINSSIKIMNDKTFYTEINQIIFNS